MDEKNNTACGQQRQSPVYILSLNYLFKYKANMLLSVCYYQREQK